MKTILTILASGLGSFAFASSQTCGSGVLITSQTYNVFAVSPRKIQSSLEKNASDFCHDQMSGNVPRQLSETLEVRRSSVPFLVQYEACFKCD